MGNKILFLLLIILTILFNRTSILHFTSKKDLMSHLKIIKEGRAVLFFSSVYYNSWLYNYGIKIGHLARESLNAEWMALVLTNRSPLLAPFNWV